MPITQKEIAQKMGVSRQAVNFALTGGGNVSEAMRQEIQQVAVEMGYRRNSLASSMATGKYQTVGFIKHHTDENTNFHLSGVLTAANERGYSVKVVVIDHNDKARFVARCVELRLSGIVAVHLPPDFQQLLLAELNRNGIPLVVLDNSFPQPYGIRVMGDDHLGMQKGVEHLFGLGHRQIVLLNADRSSGAAMAREQGYRDAMQQLGLPLPCEPLHSTYVDDALTADLTRQLFEIGGVRPTAVACATDLMAMVVCRTLRRLGLRVPQDVSVVGYDDIEAAPRVDPPLTTIRQPFEEMGKVAGDLLLDSLNEGFAAYSGCLIERFLQPQLIVRESTGPVSHLE
jgi:LacI family transcriptional regulator